MTVTNALDTTVRHLAGTLNPPAAPEVLSFTSAADPAEATGGALTVLPPPVPSKPGRPRLTPVQRNLRGDTMLMRRLIGEKVAAIAADFHLSPNTASKILKDAERRNMITVARDKVLQLVPKALAVVDYHLEEGDKDVGLEVLKGTGLLSRQGGVAAEVPLAPGESEETFVAWRRRIVAGGVKPPSAEGSCESDSPVIDVTPVAVEEGPSSNPAPVV